MVTSMWGHIDVGGWMNQAYSRLSTTHGHITDCKLDSVVYAGVCVVISHRCGDKRVVTHILVTRVYGDTDTTLCHKCKVTQICAATKSLTRTIDMWGQRHGDTNMRWLKSYVIPKWTPHSRGRARSALAWTNHSVPVIQTTIHVCTLC